jgi:hypothetical protein
MNEKPVLLVDVDGVLNPYAHQGALAAGWETHRIAARQPGRDVAVTYTVYLNPDHGSWLVELAYDFDLAWATTWEEQANTLIAPKIGLSQPLPVAAVVWGRHGYDKVAGIAALVGDRPCAWLDDDPGYAGFEWSDERRARDIPTLIITPDPAIGFTRAHKDKLRRFAVSLRA